MFNKAILILSCLLCMMLVLPLAAAERLEFTCDSMLEKDKAKEFCWGWLDTHTYDLGKEVYVDSIDGWLNGGPSELNRDITIEVQISTDSKTFETVDEVEVLADANTKTEYDVDIGAQARYIRFYAPDETSADLSPGEEIWITNRYVDGSSLNVETGQRTFFKKVIDFVLLKWLF